MIKKINHIGIAVKQIEETIKVYSEALDLKVEGYEEVAEQKVKIAFITIGESRIELLESTDPGGPISKFIEAKGEGTHHIAIEVDDIEDQLEELKTKGLRLIDEKIISWSSNFTYDYRLIIWSFEKDEKVAILKGHTANINGALELSDGRVLSWSDDGTLRIWTTKNTVTTHSKEGHDTKVVEVLDLENGKILTRSLDCSLCFWSLKDNKPIEFFEENIIRQFTSSFENVISSIIVLKLSRFFFSFGHRVEFQVHYGRLKVT